jgi:hypothetical protein
MTHVYTLGIYAEDVLKLEHAMTSLFESLCIRQRIPGKLTQPSLRPDRLMRRFRSFRVTYSRASLQMDDKHMPSTLMPGEKCWRGCDTGATPLPLQDPAIQLSAAWCFPARTVLALVNFWSGSACVIAVNLSLDNSCAGAAPTTFKSRDLVQALCYEIDAFLGNHLCTVSSVNVSIWPTPRRRLCTSNLL